MVPVSALFFIIFLEGYIVLSTELLAIRLLVPFTGSGTDTVSIIIAAVLLPLAFGYFAGGRYRGAKKSSQTVRNRLVMNLVVSAAILTVGLSYTFLDGVFSYAQKALGYNRLWLTTVYCLLFIVYPVFLLGQTVPLISNYFSREKLSSIAGRILFFSTLGSFMGAILSTLVLMTFLGVHHTVSITIGGMAVLAFYLSKKKISAPTICVSICLALTLALNSAAAMKNMHVVSNNKYSTIQIIEGNGMRTLQLNRTAASQVYHGSTETVTDYALYVEENFLRPVFTEGEVKTVVILGAGGFAIGREDTKNKYIYVDIDGALKNIAEKQFLEEKLTPNKKFVEIDARAFLIQSKEKYDIILFDVFRDPTSVYEGLNTVEFYQLLKDHLKEGGVMVGNYWGSPAFNDPYSRNLDNTLRAVFPNINRQIINPFNVWKRENDWHNIVYSAVNRTVDDAAVYTDDKNAVVYDKPAHLIH